MHTNLCASRRELQGILDFLRKRDELTILCSRRRRPDRCRLSQRTSVGRSGRFRDFKDSSGIRPKTAEPVDSRKTTVHSARDAGETPAA